VASCPVVRALISLHRRPEIILRGLVQFQKSVAASPAFPLIRKLLARRGDKVIQTHSDKRPPDVCGGLRLR